MRKVVISLLIVMLAMAPAAVLFASGSGEQDGAERHAFVFKNTGNPYGDKQMEGFEEGIVEQGGGSTGYLDQYHR